MIARNIVRCERRVEPAERCTAAMVLATFGQSPASLRAALATRWASSAVIHQRAAMIPLAVLPTMMIPTSSRSTMVIAVAPQAARYSVARFRFGAFRIVLALF